jgi:hypothetical protein
MCASRVAGTGEQLGIQERGAEMSLNTSESVLPAVAIHKQN